MKPENVFLLPPKERIKHWKKFRDTLNSQQSDETQLLLVQEYWHQYPYIERLLDPYDKSGWPTPWEILYSGDICKISIAYLMQQTLLMSDNRWNSDRIKLVYIRDVELSADIMVVVVDAKYVLNYSLHELTEFDKLLSKCDILQ